MAIVRGEAPGFWKRWKREQEIQMSKSVSKSAYSAGAREERAVIRRYLRRQWKTASTTESSTVTLDRVLNWILKRADRFDKRKGGL